MQNEPLGTDYEAAVQRAETVLLPAFDSWRSGGSSDAPVADAARPGTLDWLFAEYRADRRFTKLDPKTRRNHEVGFRLVGGYVLKDGRRLGEARLTAITTAVTDALYEKLLVVTDDDGNVIARAAHHHQPRDEDLPPRLERRCATQSRQGAAGQSVRADGAAFVRSRDADRDYAELQAFRAKAIEMGSVARHGRADRHGNGCSASKTSSPPSTWRITVRRSGPTPCACCTRRPGRKIGCRCSTTTACRSIPN